MTKHECIDLLDELLVTLEISTRNYYNDMTNKNVEVMESTVKRIQQVHNEMQDITYNNIIKEVELDEKECDLVNR